MLDLVSALARPIAKLLLKSWLGDTASTAGDNLLKLAFDRLGDRNKAREAQRRADAIAGAVVRDLQDFFARERVNEGALTTAAFDLGETVGRHVDAAFLVHQRLKTAVIEKALLKARPVGGMFSPAEPEHDLYLRLVKALAPRLRAVAPELPDFALERDAELLDKMARVADDTPRILTEIRAVRARVEEREGREERQRADYEVDYRRLVRQKLNFVEILGLDVERTRRDADLSVAYLSLTTNMGGLGRLDYEALLDLLPAFGNRLLIEGAAGSGKSTLLRWTAVEAAAADGGDGEAPTRRKMRLIGHLAQCCEASATDEEIGAGLGGRPGWLAEFRIWLQEMTGEDDMRRPAPGPLLRPVGARLAISLPEPLREVLDGWLAGHWRDAVPFLIRLRHLKDGLPQPDDLPAHLSTALGGPPENWVRERLLVGKALLLIDGVDEVPEGAARESVLNSVKDYVELYDRCPVIVASRPRAFDKERLRALGFVEAEVDELTPDQRARFIDSWHRALAVNLRRAEDDPEFTGYAERLKVALDRQPHIARLATNPLLCAGICALHERNPETLPKDEYDLCAKLTEMLVELRDRSHGKQKPVRMEEFGAAYQLPYPDKRGILARIGEAMVSQELSALPRNEALAHVASALPELRRPDGLTPEAVLGALEARSGVLRSAGSGPTDVALSELPEHGTLSDGAAAPRDAVEFVHNTLKAWLAALYCLQLNKPRELAKQASATGYAEVIPFVAAAPEGRAYAEALIGALLQRAEGIKAAGKRRPLLILALRCDAVAPNLPKGLRQRLAALPGVVFPPQSFDEAQQLAALGDAAVPHLAPRAQSSEAEAAACVRCLRLIGTKRARDALDAYRTSKAWPVIEELAQSLDPLTLPLVLSAAQDFTRWRSVPDSIKARICGLAPLQGLTALQGLSLDGTQVSDLAPLRGLTALQELSLDGTQVRDLAPLRGLTALQGLYLSQTQVRDLAPLRGLTALQGLSLDGTQVRDLTPLQGFTALQTLSLDGTQVRNLAPLQGLTALQGLWLSQTQVHDLAPLEGLSALQELSVSQTQVTPDEVTKLKVALARKGNRSLHVVGPT